VCLVACALLNTVALYDAGKTAAAAVAPAAAGDGGYPSTAVLVAVGATAGAAAGLLTSPAEMLVASLKGPSSSQAESASGTVAGGQRRSSSGLPGAAGVRGGALLAARGVPGNPSALSRSGPEVGPSLAAAAATPVGRPRPEAPRRAPREAQELPQAPSQLRHGSGSQIQVGLRGRFAQAAAALEAVARSMTPTALLSGAKFTHVAPTLALVRTRVLWSALEGALFFPALECAIPLCDALFVPEEEGGDVQQAHADHAWWLPPGAAPVHHPHHPLHW
jgi:hypothetical protein